MATALGLAIPGSVLLLLLVGGYELKRRRRTDLASGRMISTVLTDELTALLYPTKRMELDHRADISMLRDEETDGDPVDLERGTARIRER
ncbi:DUF6191 domain-containing protein [Nocardia asteroides]|uniref:DUF6191 domain-containing protein n=1 Tax=Nocardia asteroides TaxID=1824 RepID=UPI001E28CA34|nr:DUF6191 domain-containing protein [Nocardia asteroides]UGT59118.1 DUF6191 domain-containing protein [Nocardia asteroides]